MELDLNKKRIINLESLIETKKDFIDFCVSEFNTSCRKGYSWYPKFNKKDKAIFSLVMKNLFNKGDEIFFTFTENNYIGHREIDILKICDYFKEHGVYSTLLFFRFF
ncbi:MAG: hypothetical protein EAZ06_07565 [Cytophagales bacterium]|nr:MAG: hypothetical protein EAZ06_07565 [Cytophagales bacterium]